MLVVALKKNPKHFICSEEEPIAAEKACCLFSVNGEGHISNIVRVSALGIGKLDVLKASTSSVCHFLIFSVDVTNCHREEFVGFLVIFIRGSSVALVDCTVSNFFFIDLNLLRGFLKEIGLSGIIVYEFLAW